MYVQPASFFFFSFSFFFFKQKTAYEIGVRLVGSEMCIRDRAIAVIFALSMYYLAVSANNPFLYFNF